MTGWHEAKTDPPKKSGKYLTYKYYGDVHLGFYHIYNYALDLSKASCDFEHRVGEPGWWEYDSEWGDYLIQDVGYWLELPAPPEFDDE